ncbi:Ubiquinone biosynthesis protein coq9, mitochondrial [Chytridiales sp. JEL 0842]|nr:Ubiquinone biosynthesis protein coq9, mitochondrial [Chytridiales sp. JEL 0842]
MTMKVTEKVKTGVLLRLSKLEPYKDRWPEALALMALPHNAPYALYNLGELVDEIWYMAGDRSADMNWYSKRALLAGVYTSTELFMTQDKSADLSATKRFLDDRLKDVAFVGRSIGELNALVSFGAKSLMGLLESSKEGQAQSANRFNTSWANTTPPRMQQFNPQQYPPSPMAQPYVHHQMHAQFEYNAFIQAQMGMGPMQQYHLHHSPMQGHAHVMVGGGPHHAYHGGGGMMEMSPIRSPMPFIPQQRQPKFISPEAGTEPGFGRHQRFSSGPEQQVFNGRGQPKLFSGAEPMHIQQQQQQQQQQQRPMNIDELEGLRSENHALIKSLEDRDKQHGDLFEQFLKKEEELAFTKKLLENLKASKGEPGPKDPGWGVVFEMMKREVTEKNQLIERMKQELQAVQFTPTSIIGKRLIAKVKALQLENEDLGKRLCFGQVASLNIEINTLKQRVKALEDKLASTESVAASLDEENQELTKTALLLRQKVKLIEKESSGGEET